MNNVVNLRDWSTPPEMSGPIYAGPGKPKLRARTIILRAVGFTIILGTILAAGFCFVVVVGVAVRAVMP